MDSTFKVPVTKILKLENHPGADRLEVATIYGFQVVVPKNQYQVNEKVVYIPIDAILSNKVESVLFAPDAKVKLTKGRVRQIKLRGYVSQGMVCKPETLNSIVNLDKAKLESDVSLMLDITKFEPPAPKENNLKQTPGSRKASAHPDFHKYNGLTNLKWAPNLFDGKEVVIQEKIHGTNCRAAKLPYRANTIFKKIKKFFKMTQEFEELYGSNNVDITNSRGYSGFYGTDVYGAALAECDAFNKIQNNEIIFGEVFGPGIQKGYTYGLDKPRFILFDVKRLNSDGSQTWLDPEEVEAYAKERGFEMVPVLYRGIYNLEMAKLLTEGVSDYSSKEKVKEGVVVKLRTGYSLEGNKQGLKVISEEYLSKENSDFH